MGEWSPECERVVWIGGATKATPGARFLGFNMRDGIRWVTQGRITVATEGRHLAFDVHIGLFRISSWEYFVVPDEYGEGCTLVEQWTDRRPGFVGSLNDRFLGSRRHINRRGIRRTLVSVKAAAEKSLPSSFADSR